MVDRCSHRARGRYGLNLAEVRIQPVELPHLSVSSPANVRVAGCPEIEARNFFEPVLSVETSSKLVGKRLIVDEVVGLCGADSSVIQAHRIEIARFESCDLGGDQGGPIFEVLRALVGPDAELTLVRGQRFPMTRAFVAVCGIAGGGEGKRTKKMVLGDLNCWRRHRKQTLRPRCRFDRGCKATGEEARLELPDPVIELANREDRVAGELVLDLTLVNLTIVEGAECSGQATKRAHQAQLRHDGKDDDEERPPLLEIQAGFDLLLCTPSGSPTASMFMFSRSALTAA